MRSAFGRGGAYAIYMFEKGKPSREIKTSSTLYILCKVSCSL